MTSVESDRVDLLISADHPEIGMARVDGDGIIAIHNDRFASIIEHDGASFRGRRLLDVIRPAGPVSTLSGVRAILSGEASSGTDRARVASRTGGGVWVQLSIVSVHGGRARPPYFLVTLEDIPQRWGTWTQKKSERGLATRIAELIPAGIIVIDREGKITFANSYAQEVMGMRMDELVHNAVIKFGVRFIKLDRSPYPLDELPITRVFTDGEPVHDARFGVVAPDGRYDFVSTNAAPILDGKGELEQVVLVTTYITEWVLSEERLRRKLEVERIVSNAATGFLSTGAHDIGPRTMTALGEVARFLGAARVFVCWFEDAHSGCHSCVEWCAEGVSRQLDGPGSDLANRLLEIISSGGGKAHRRQEAGDALLLVPIRMFGQVRGVIGCEHASPGGAWPEDAEGLLFTVGNVIAGALERSHAEEEVRRYLHDMAFLARTATALVELPPDGDPFDFITERVCELAGSPALVVGAEVDEGLYIARSIRCAEPGLEALATALEDPEITTRLFDDLLDSGSSHALHVVDLSSSEPVQEMIGLAEGPEERAGSLEIAAMGLIRRDMRYGGIAIVATRGSIYERREVLEAFIGQATVALERRRAEVEKRELEQRLVHARKLEALGTLAGGIAHDFGNQLTGILGFAHMLREESEPGSSTHAAAEVIETSARNAQKLTKQLLGFARRDEVELDPVDVADLVSNIRSLLSRTIDKKIEVVVENGARHSTVLANAAQLERVLMNIAINARDAMPGGGRLVFEMTDVQGEEAIPTGQVEAPEGSCLRIRISDTGVGMPAETLSKIFEPFYSTKGAEGSGLGLALAYGIVKQHRGLITVESEEGRGSRFDIYLPVCEPSPVASPPADVPRRIRSGTILVVDDEASVRSLARAILEKMGYEVLMAGDGPEGIRIFSEQSCRIDLVMLDFAMPHMDGRECFERLQSIDPDVKVILASAYLSDKVIRELRGMGLVDTITKPYLPPDLSDLLDDFFEQRAAGC